MAAKSRNKENGGKPANPYTHGGNKVKKKETKGEPLKGEAKVYYNSTVFSCGWLQGVTVGTSMFQSRYFVEMYEDVIAPYFHMTIGLPDETVE